MSLLIKARIPLKRYFPVSTGRFPGCMKSSAPLQQKALFTPLTRMPVPEHLRQSTLKPAAYCDLSRRFGVKATISTIRPPGSSRIATTIPARSSIICYESRSASSLSSKAASSFEISGLREPASTATGANSLVDRDRPDSMRSIPTPTPMIASPGMT